MDNCVTIIYDQSVFYSKYDYFKVALLEYESRAK